MRLRTSDAQIFQQSVDKLESSSFAAQGGDREMVVYSGVYSLSTMVEPLSVW